MVDNSEGVEPVALQLPRSGLIVRDGELLRSEKGAILARHPLIEVVEISTCRTLDPIGIFLTLALAAGAVAAAFFIRSRGWGWGLFIVLWVLVKVGIVRLWRDWLLFKLRQGEVRYEIKDNLQDAGGFRLSLKRMIGFK